MHVEVYEDAQAVGKRGAVLAVEQLKVAIAERGEAVLLVSTGASQFAVMEHLCAADVPWDLVSVLHLDEYVSLPADHPASFRRYLRERLVDVVRPRRFVPVDADGELGEVLPLLETLATEFPVDAALIGVGENAHIAFNDPPADFSAAEAFRVVTLDRRCREQQVREGWFPTVEAVPEQAVTMTVWQILRSKRIISCVPYDLKAEAVRAMLEEPVSEDVPATALRDHTDMWLILDTASAAKTPRNVLAKYQSQTSGNGVSEGRHGVPKASASERP